MITTELFGMAFEPEQKFENPDDTPIVMDRDYFGKEWGESTGVWPFLEKLYYNSRVFGSGSL